MTHDPSTDRISDLIDTLSNRPGFQEAIAQHCPTVQPLSDEPVLQLTEGDRYFVQCADGPKHRCAFMGTAIMHGYLAAIFQMPNGQVFHITQNEGSAFTIKNL